MNRSFLSRSSAFSSVLARRSLRRYRQTRSRPRLWRHPPNRLSCRRSNAVPRSIEAGYWPPRVVEHLGFRVHDRTTLRIEGPRCEDDAVVRAGIRKRIHRLVRLVVGRDIGGERVLHRGEAAVEIRIVAAFGKFVETADRLPEADDELGAKRKSFATRPAIASRCASEPSR